MDLARTRLHFVLGSKEPASPVSVDRTGQIPEADLKPGFLLAAFNGGFKANQGQFGAMVYGLEVLPPRPGLGVIGMYADGQVRIGAWGSEITPSPQLITWRQNGPLIIQAGEINPRTADFDPQTWGYAVRGSTATWRSGVGISSDRRTLFYAAGPDLTLPALAASLQAAGSYQALQLDINDYWVHFDAFRAAGAGLQPVCLLDEMKSMDDLRYLTGFSRDFFYLTLVSQPY
ncbi:MAG TPA: phosphodiester glycosidase family protein [Anaerolineales bacterium]